MGEHGHKQKDQKKENKKDVYQQNEDIVSDWITLSSNKKSFTSLEHIGINEKLKLPYEGRQLFTRWAHSYPNSNEIKSKTFYIKYDNELSLINKIMLNNFQSKYFYHAIDDIMHSLESRPIERDNLLAIIYSPILYLQNNFSIDFFDIWVDEVYINQESKVNKFLAEDSSNFELFNFCIQQNFLSKNLNLYGNSWIRLKESYFYKLKIHVLIKYGQFAISKSSSKIYSDVST